MYVGYERRGFRYLEIFHSYSHNSKVYHSGDKIGDNGRFGYRYQETSNFSSLNCVSRFDIDCIGGYRSHNRHSSSHNAGVHGRLLGF